MEVSTIIFFCLYVPEKKQRGRREERSGKGKTQKPGAIVSLIWEKSCKTAWPLVHLVPKPGLTVKRKRRRFIF